MLCVWKGTQHRRFILESPTRMHGRNRNFKHQEACLEPDAFKVEVGEELAGQVAYGQGFVVGRGVRPQGSGGLMLSPDCRHCPRLLPCHKPTRKSRILAISTELLTLVARWAA